MLLGLLGSILPGLPGVPVIFISALVYTYLTSFEDIGVLVLVILGLFALLAFVADFLGTAYGVRRFGASNWGTVGGAIGGLLGTLAGALFLGVGALFGLLAGSVGGVLVGEYLRRERRVTTPPGARNWRRTSRAAGGVLVGYLISTVIQSVIGVLSIVVFVLALFY